MKKLGIISISSFAIFLFVLAFTPRALAQSNFRQGKQMILPKNEVVNENYFASGDSVQVSGTVNGDVYAASGNIIIDGTVNGDVIVVGGNIYVAGKVAGNVRAVGGQVNLTGEVGKNATVVGGQIMLSDGAKFGGSFTAAGGNVEINSAVSGNIEVAGGNLMVNDEVGKNVNFAGGNLQLGNEAKVEGNVTYYSEVSAVVLSGAKVEGELKQHLPPQEIKEARYAGKDAGVAFFKFWMLVSFVSALVLGLLFAKFVPIFTQKTVDSIKSKFLANLGFGFVIVVMVPLAAVALFITMLGIPLGFILITVYMLMLYFVKIFAAVFVGQFLTHRASPKKSLYLDVFVGLVIYYLLSLIPIIGWVTQAVLVLTSVGALLRTKKEIFVSMAEKKLI